MVSTKRCKFHVTEGTAPITRAAIISAPPLVMVIGGSVPESIRAVSGRQRTIHSI